jgi:hypothetical protein
VFLQTSNAIVTVETATQLCFADVCPIRDILAAACESKKIFFSAMPGYLFGPDQ